MVNTIKYTKNFKINYKVINEEDIYRLAKLIDSLYMRDEYKKEFTVYFDDNTRISGIDKSVFDSDEFKRRRSIQISMIYYSKNSEKDISIDLHSTIEYRKYSHVSVSSIDKDWYNSTLQEVKSIIDEIENQCKIAVLDNNSALVVIPILLGSLASIPIISFVLHVFPQLYDKSYSGLCLIIIISILLILYFVFLKIVFDIVIIFPKIDFTFGPEYKNASGKRKRLWLWIIGVIIIPAAMTVISLIISKK